MPQQSIGDACSCMLDEGKRTTSSHWRARARSPAVAWKRVFRYSLFDFDERKKKTDSQSSSACGQHTASISDWVFVEKLCWEKCAAIWVGKYWFINRLLGTSRYWTFFIIVILLFHASIFKWQGLLNRSVRLAFSWDFFIHHNFDYDGVCSVGNTIFSSTWTKKLVKIFRRHREFILDKTGLDRIKSALCWWRVLKTAAHWICSLMQNT